MQKLFYYSVYAANITYYRKVFIINDLVYAAVCKLLAICLFLYKVWLSVKSVDEKYSSF